MTNLLSIVFLVTSISSFGQTCDTIKGRVINCIDSNGLKQGLWEDGVYDWRQQENYGPVSGFCKTAPLVRTKIGVTATGSYRDNKKIGTWKHFGGSHLGAVERELTYNDNGTITEKNFIYSSVIEYSNDSTLITGFIYHRGDTINVFCSNKKGTFKLDNDKVLLTFDCRDFFNFDFELSRLAYGVYDREIKLIKISNKTK